MNYKEAYDKLQKIVDEMNKGDLSIEDMVDRYEEGMTLYKDLSKKLENLEQRVSVLALNEDDELEEKKFEGEI